jgi:hypothetical protein
VEAVSSAAPSDRFYDRQAFTIRYKLEGTQTGTRAEYVRDWGKLRVLEEDSVLRVMGTEQAVRNRQLIEGSQIYTVRLPDNTVTVMENPLYQELTAEMQGQDPVEFGRAMMRRMGGTETGETGRFAGHDCTYWTILGGRTCITPWGGTLYVENQVGGIRIVQEATEVRLGDGGPDSLFQVDKASAQRIEGPNMSMQDVEAAAKAGEEAMRQLQQMAPGG